MIYEDERSSENPIPCITIEDDVSIDQPNPCTKPNHEKSPIQVRKDLYDKDVSIECDKSNCESPGPSQKQRHVIYIVQSNEQDIVEQRKIEHKNFEQMYSNFLNSIDNVENIINLTSDKLESKHVNLYCIDIQKQLSNCFENWLLSQCNCSTFICQNQECFRCRNVHNEKD